MDAVTLTVAIRGAGELALIVGGVYALYSGFRIIRGRSPDRSRATFKILGLSTTAQGVGAVVMTTAVAWAYLGVRMAPNLSTDGTGTKVYSFQTDQGRVTAPALAIASAGTERPSQSNIADLRQMFKDSVLANQAISAGHTGATVLGRSAMIDPESASAVQQIGNSLLLSAVLKSRDKSAEVTFVAEKRGNITVFLPSTVKIDGSRPPGAVAVVPNSDRDSDE
jgi:hypothetical protein